MSAAIALPLAEQTAVPSSTRRLTGPEAESLWRNWKERGDVRSRDRLVLAYSPMVNYLATRKARELPAHCDLDDLISCGLIAILEAVDRFEPAKGATFEQFIWTRVAGSIVDELRRQDRVSRSTRSLSRTIKTTQEKWLTQHGRHANETELAAELKIDLGRAATAHRRARPRTPDLAQCAGRRRAGRRDRRDDRRGPRPRRSRPRTPRARKVGGVQGSDRSAHGP